MTLWSSGDLPPVFFEAMQVGYASGADVGTIPDLPGSKKIVFTKGIFKVVDVWFPGPISSSGTTVIFASDRPAWTMQYWGKYEKKEIPFLKKALAASYALGHFPYACLEYFTACRGPKVYKSEEFPDLTYVNMPDDGSTFYDFAGREEVLNGNGIRIGWHEYHGHLLL